MRSDTRLTIFTAAAGVALLALGFVWLVLGGGAATSPGVAVALAAGLAVITAFITASALAARYRNRAQAIVDIGRRYALGDLSRPGPDYGDDDLGMAARALDAAVHEQERRIVSLARDRARMQAILGSMVEGVLVVDESGRLQLVNEAARRMLRIESDAAGRPYVEALRHPGVVEHVGRLLTGGPPQTLEFSTSRDASRELVARLAPVAGTGRGVVVVLHDVTDLKRADQIRRDFVANVSHELRTPLTAIRGYAEALVDDSEDPEARRRFLEIIQRHATRMERLVKDLLRLAMLDAGKEMLETAPADIGALVQGIVDDMATAAAAKHLRVATSAGPGTKGLAVDAAKVHDIVRNLVENAINYTQPGGDVAIAATAEGDVLVITVTDNGPGIPPEDLGRVFERFYRVDKSRGRPGGTGLGLAIVKHLADLHGGSVTVENRALGGAAFTVRLPVAPRAPLT
ncbi:MAG: PAS domain-containing protein [Acidobacteria bacterium]|nr:PAS domain-containing protein [Acidobacteriota bacterium]